MSDISRFCSRVCQVAGVVLLLTALFQEMEKPPEKRYWHGKVLGGVPYDFRLPTLERLRNRFWNPYDERLLIPTIFGVGWAINMHTLLENVRLNRQDFTERHFLMPTQSIEEVLRPYLDEE